MVCFLTRLRLRLRALFNRRHDRKLREELEFHVEELASRGELVPRKRSAAVDSGIRKWVGRLERMPESVDEFIDDVRGS